MSRHCHHDVRAGRGRGRGRGRRGAWFQREREQLVADYWRNLKLSTEAFLETQLKFSMLIFQHISRLLVLCLPVPYAVSFSVSYCSLSRKRRQGKYLFYTDIIKAQYAMPFCFVRATDGWQRQREEGGQQVIYLRQVQAVGRTDTGGRTVQIMK